jgi:hypothetical protein
VTNAKVFWKHLDFHCGTCRKGGHWEGNIPVGANLATYQPPAGWAFIPRFLRSKETGIVIALQVPICSEACAKAFVAAQGQNVREVVEVMKAIGVAQAAFVQPEVQSLTAVPTLPPRKP